MPEPARAKKPRQLLQSLFFAQKAAAADSTITVPPALSAAEPLYHPGWVKRLPEAPCESMKTLDGSATESKL
jgi:hypothetical protein